jgi:hypothetical protein
VVARDSPQPVGQRVALVLALALALAGGLSFWAGRGLVFRGDEWSWLTSGLHVTANSVLGDYNGHLLAYTKGFFWLVPSLVGLGHYWVIRALSIVPNLVVAWLVGRLAAPRVGPWPAVFAAAVVAFLGTGCDVFLSAADAGITVAVAACLGALAALDRGRRSGDGWACVLLALGLASFSVAVAFAVGILIELLATRQWRRLWIVLAPGVLYIAWRIHWGSSISGGSGHSRGVLHLLGHAVSAMTGGAAGVVGVQLSSPTLRSDLPWLGTLAEVLVVVLAVALLAWVCLRRRLTARLANLAITGVALWLLLGYGRGSLGGLQASRYVYQGAIVIVLLLVELAPAVVIRRGMIRRTLGGLVVVSVCLNIVWLVVWADFLRRQSTSVRAQLTALQLARPRVAPDFVPGAGFTLRALTAGHYFQMLQTFGGSPADSLAELRHAPASARDQADATLIHALDLHLRPGFPSAGAQAAILEGIPSGLAQTISGCIRAQPRGAAAGVVNFAVRPSARLGFEVPKGGLLLVSARLFGNQFHPISGIRSTGQRLALRLPPIGIDATWQFQARYDVPVRICGGA